MSDEVRETWSAVAPAWEEHRDFVAAMTSDITDAMLDRLPLRAGATVLELACGTGETGFEVASRIAPGTLIQTDLAAPMLDAARRGAVARGLDTIEHRVLDAQRMDLADGSVDAIVCRYAFMLMPDQRAAFAECARVLRPNGSLVFAVWGPAERNLWILSIALPLVQAGKMPLIDPNEPGGLFSLATSERVGEILSEAGFRDVTADEVVTAMEVDDFDPWWERQASLAGPLAVILDALPSDERAQMREGSRQILEAHRDGSTYRLSASSLVVAARRA